MEAGFFVFLYGKIIAMQSHDTSSEDELVFDTQGTSINEAFGYEDEEDDMPDFDSFDDKDE